MFDELKNAVKAQLYEKAISPLSGGFILSWVLWNYRFILVLMSSSPYSEKISYIDKLPISEQTFLYGFFLPLLSASAFIVLYPYPSKFFYEISRKWQREIKELQQRIDDEMPMDQEEARKIRRESLQAEIEFDKELKNKSDEISRLKEIIEQLEQQNASLKARETQRVVVPQDRKYPTLNRMQFDMLVEIAEAAEKGRVLSALVTSYGALAGSSNVLAQHCVDELEKMNLIKIKSGSTDNDDWCYVVTKEGRAFLVNNQRPE